MSDTGFSPTPEPFRAAVTVPGDKSLSHRALILAAMARGTSRVTGTGPGLDVAATRRLVTALGITVSGDRLESPGVAGWRDPGSPLDAGNSGTTLRVLAGALAGRPFTSTLIGDRSLMRRPMGRLVGPLTALGASVELSDDRTPPVTIHGGPLRGAAISLPVASAQVRTAAALAAVQAAGASEIDSPPGFRDHTERWLGALGRGEMVSPTRLRILPGPIPVLDLAVPGDPSSAAFLWAAAALSPGSAVTTPGVSLNPGRIGFLEVLRAMGAIVAVAATGDVLGDPVGDVTVTGSQLVGGDVGGDLAVATLDELPLVGVLGAFAEGETKVAGAAELRVKESDRIAATVEMIRALGGAAEPLDDGFVVLGGRPAGGVVDARGDHRIAMAAAVAATRSRDGVRVIGMDAAAVSWPGFVDELERAWSSR